MRCKGDDMETSLLHQEIKEIRKEVRSLHEEMTKYKGFVGGVLWSIAAIVTAANFLFSYIKNMVAS